MKYTTTKEKLDEFINIIRKENISDRTIELIKPDFFELEGGE